MEFFIQNFEYNSKFKIVNEIQILGFYKTALHIATEKNYYKIVKLLLANEKINLTVQDDIFILLF